MTNTRNEGFHILPKVGIKMTNTRNEGFYILPIDKNTDVTDTRNDPIKKVIHNDPATIVYWLDGSKTVVKCGEGDIYDPEKGLAMAIAKKFLGNKGNYYDTFKKWLPEEEDALMKFLLDGIRD